MLCSRSNAKRTTYNCSATGDVMCKVYKKKTKFRILTLNNFPTETGISTQNFCIANATSDDEVNFFTYSLPSVHKKIQ